MSENSPYSNELLSKICQSIRGDIAARSAIQDDTLLRLRKQINLTIMYGRTTDMPNSFWQLKEAVSDYWQYYLKDETDISKCFSYARTFELVKTIESFNNQREQMEQVKTDNSVFRQHSKILDAINKNPGIIHKDLCKETGYEKTRLSQISSELESKKYIFSQRQGREKYYYITTLGRQLLDQIVFEETPIQKQLNDQKLFIFDLIGLIKRRNPDMLKKIIPNKALESDNGLLAYVSEHMQHMTDEEIKYAILRLQTIYYSIDKPQPQKNTYFYDLIVSQKPNTFTISEEDLLTKEVSRSNRMLDRFLNLKNIEGEQFGKNLNSELPKECYC